MIPSDAVLSVLGIVLGIIGIWASLLKKYQVVIVTVCSVIGLSGYSLLLIYEHNNEVAQTEAEIKERLANNRWTSDQLLKTMRKPDYTVFHEALSRAVASGAIHDQPTSCLESTVNGGAELDTRVYFQ